ncbi:Oxidoreductase [Paecilomyces lecythidis]|uniref:Mitochondrial intermembrane space import and assembly protein 40 n=1 Tax=Paecilomyces lecythidis TaxID=3004212 RepID=A0ABR3WZZ3_9EURO
MFRPASRALLRAPAAAVGAPGRIQSSRRLISTAPPTKKSRSWKSLVLRAGLATGVVYYYNTSNLFAEQPSFSLRPQPKVEEDIDKLPTLDSIKPKRRQEQQKQQQDAVKTDAQSATTTAEVAGQSSDGLSSPEELEEQAGQEGAFNPETGEINWDCPCLGGMAHGPCGEEFKAAFSCFVYSTEEPKGMDCIEKFKGMQDCFRQHPDVYGAELDDDEVDTQLRDQIAAEDNKTSQPSAAEIDAASHPDEKRARAKDVHAQAKVAAAGGTEHSESDELVPKQYHDTREKNETA